MIFDRVFSAVYNFIHNNKWKVALFILLLVALSIIRICSVSFQNDISLMLPDNKDVKRYMSVFQDSNIADKVVISFSLKDNKHSIGSLTSAVDKFASNLNSPLITRIDSSFSSNSPIDDIKRFLGYAPQLISPQMLTKIEKKITPAGVKSALKADFQRLLAPGGSFSIGFIQLDPLNIYTGIFNSFTRLTASMGYTVIPKNNHLFSKDMKHVMVILETPVPITDAGGAKLLLKYINKHLSSLPSYVKSSVVCGHLHAVSNEKTIKKDIQIVLLISAIGFILLFILILQKDLRCFLVLILPVTAGLISIALLSLFIKNISYFIIGMGGVITGIAVDYGIHIYTTAMLEKNTAADNNNLNSIRSIAKPIIVGALTTAGIFLAFLFSNVAGYHQLSYFSIFSILISLLFALFILPQFLSKNKKINLLFLNRLNPEKITSKFYLALSIIIVWILILTVFSVFSSEQKLNNDISQFDGSSPEIFQNEKNFHDIWGGSNMPAILVTSADTQIKLFELNENLNKELSKTIGKDYFNLASIWPSLKTRKENLKNWSEFWNKNENNLKKLIVKYSEQYGFSEDAFEPFYKSLKADNKATVLPVNNPVFDSLARQFIYEKNNKYYMLSFFPDKLTTLEKVKKVCGKFPDSYVVSREAFSGLVSGALEHEIILLAFIAAVIIPLLVLILLKNIFKTCLALIPVVSSLIAITGVLYLIGIPLNTPVIIAGLITVGLSIDYGVFMVYHQTSCSNPGTFAALTLSALSTIIGAGSVIFAHHPLLFNIGITLVSGVGTGYVVSVLIIPSVITIKSKVLGN